MATPFTVYKLIVLYMLQNTENTLTNSQISEFILDREYTNYFHLQQAISELVEAELITMDTRSIEIDPSNARAYYNRAISKLIVDNYKEALQDLEISKRLGYSKAAEIISQYY